MKNTMELFSTAAKLILILFGICLAGVVLLVMVFLIFVGAMGEEKVTQIIPSPDGSYRVEMISYNEGALGGSVEVRLVEVTNLKRLSEVGEKPRGKGETIARGNWGDDERMTVIWTEDTLFQLIYIYDSGSRAVMEVSIGEDGVTTSGWEYPEQKEIPSEEENSEENRKERVEQE
ncbi:MAG: hypothetical protein IJP31_11485 [Lachnospiraceae bacterium]|nr:hypothetical protein [Lachnospiraceae bacterium]